MADQRPARVVRRSRLAAGIAGVLDPRAGQVVDRERREPDFERADRIGEFWGYPESRAFAELLIDCEEDRVLRAVLVGMLREAERLGPSGR